MHVIPRRCDINFGEILVFVSKAVLYVRYAHIKSVLALYNA